jgi:hypothetical protein
MRNILSYKLLFITLPFLINSAQGQSEGFAYAVTGIDIGSSEWVALRTLNTRAGKFSNMLINMTEKKKALYNISAHEINATSQPSFSANNASGNNATPLNNGIAAIAYDRKSNRIFYVSMNNDQLQYVDLATMTTYPVAGASFSKAGQYVFQATSPITRLVIAPDNYGYTITTDGNHLIRFTTNGTPTLTHLGDLVDDPHNNEMSIYNTCSNLGGDLVADDAGNLYLITAANRVFKIDIKTRVTTFLATISGLPSQFTTNGAAVDENGKLIVSSSVYKNGYIIVDPKIWKALPSPVDQFTYYCSDLANSNVLHTNTSTPSILFFSKSLNRSGNVRIYPNPVLFDEVKIQFNDMPPGKYTIELADPLGRKVLQQKVKITSHTQTALMQISAITAQAFYYIRILNEKNLLVSTEKLAVERW